MSATDKQIDENQYTAWADKNCTIALIWLQIRLLKSKLPKLQLAKKTLQHLQTYLTNTVSLYIFV